MLIVDIFICPYLIVFKIRPLFLKMIIFVSCVCMCAHFACLEVYMYVGMCIYIHRRQCEPQVSSSISLFLISLRHSISCTVLTFFLLDRQSANPIDHLVFVTYGAGIIDTCENSHSLLCVCWE